MHTTTNPYIARVADSAGEMIALEVPRPACTDIKVRDTSSGYTTSTVRGKRASSTHSAKAAADSLGRKLYGEKAFQRAELLPGGPDHVVTVWRLHGSAGAANVR